MLLPSTTKMPYARRRKPAAKKLVRKARKPVAKRKAKASAKDQVTKVLKVSTLITPSQGAVVSNYIRSFYTLQPSSSTTSLAFNTLPETRLWGNMYDRFRVKSIHIRVIPRANTMETSKVGGNSENNSSGVYYSVVDRDNVFSGGLTQVKRRPSTKVHSMLKGLKMSYSVKYPTDVWFDTQTDFDTFTTTDTTREIMKEIGMNGGITLYGENFPENAGRILNNSWADVEISYTLCFQGYNPGTLAYDPETRSLTLTAGDDVISPDIVQPLAFISDESGAGFNIESGEAPIIGVALVQDT